jgi:lipopolysaccharide biosynthesis glycosyltransferase
MSSKIARPEIGPDAVQIQVALASNSNYFCGLLVTVISLLASNQENTFCIHIIDGGLSKRQKRTLTKRTRHRNSKNNILFHKLDFRAFEGLRMDYGNSYMTYARILMGTFINTERVIYLDTDLLVAANVRPLWEIDLGESVVAATKDRDIQHVQDDYPFEAVGEAEYFNAGVMVVNLNLWKHLHAQEKLLQMLTASPSRFRWWDQTAMNVLFRARVLFVDGRWNRFADSVDLGKTNEGAIFHYVGQSKPWNKYLNTDGFKLWRAFFGRHVWPRWTLLLDGKFTISFLLFLRNRALCKSKLLRLLALGALKLKALINGRNPIHEVKSFLERHADNASEIEKGKDRDGELRSYVNQRWSEAI